MSLINKVLQDLDQRAAMSAPDSAPQHQVRPVAPQRGGREWFWRAVAALMILALGWVLWVAYQLQPRGAIATEAAFQAASEAKKKALQSKKGPEASGTLEPAKPAPSPAPVPTANATPAVPQDVFKLALSIDTPIAERGEKEATKPAPAAKPAQKTAVLAAVPTSPAKLKADTHLALTAPRLEKRDQTRSATDRAETEFRRAATLLNQGRVSEAESALGVALALDPAHESARQSLIALYIEQRRIPEATRLLQDGLTVNPAQTRFAVVLARIHAERSDYASALDVLTKVKATASSDAEFNSLSGAVLQRLGRHAEAAEAYRAAVHAVPHNGISWVGLAISLEALARKAEAAEAFKRAVATGTLTAEVKSYAEQRARALHGS